MKLRGGSGGTSSPRQLARAGVLGGRIGPRRVGRWNLLRSWEAGLGDGGGAGSAGVGGAVLDGIPSVSIIVCINVKKI